MSLVVDHVTTGYGEADVLHDVSLVVPPGRVVALLGPNGAGKSTLLRCCAGFLAPRRGSVTVDGVDTRGTPPHRSVRQGLCYVPEGRAVFPTLTVAENLRLLGGGSREAAERAVEAFPLLGRKMTQRAGTMSGGEQQMLALARAYVTSCRYVLLDEVSMGLAPIVVDEIFAFLAELARSGIALLVVEQYVTKALELADLVYVLHRGRVRFGGEPVELDAGALAQVYLHGGDVDSAVVGVH